MDKYSPADKYAMLRLSSNDKNEDIFLTLSRSLVITYERKMSSLYIQAHLEKKFLVLGFQ
jgi:hypothetical protein